MIFTTPLKEDSLKILLLGSGELGKEIAIEASRVGIEVVSIDSYKDAPAFALSSNSYVIDMKNRDKLLNIIRKERPTYIVPEVEAINIDALFAAEDEGFCVIPNAEAVNKTMNRKNIRVFAVEELGVKASRYRFVKTYDELVQSTKDIGFPCVIKPIMSSSGHGQSIAKNIDDLKSSWEKAKEARGDSSELIVEEFIEFDYEITLLTVRNSKDTIFCEPIGHQQKDGDYIFSWQPAKMSQIAKKRAKEIAKKVTDALGGRGVFGVEFFIKGDEVYFSEVSPRPHDTGMVTMITQSQSEFALHIRAILGLPLDFIFYQEGASGAYKSNIDSINPKFNIPNSSFSKNSIVRVFGKPNSHIGRRVAVVLTCGKNSLELAKSLVAKIEGVK